MQELRDNIRVVTFQPLASLDEDNSPIEGDGVDTRQIDDDSSPLFDTCLVTAVIGSQGADIDSIKIKFEESDDADFSDASETIIEGGAEVTVDEESTVTFQLRRTKRYIRSVVTLEASGAADTVPVAITGVLANWATPFPTV